MKLDKISEEYFNDVLVRMAYNSSAIDGNTITLAETVSIILENTIIGNKNGIKVREFYEIENHLQTFDYMIDALRNKEELSPALIKKIHELLMDRLIFDKGQYKTTQNAILGAQFNTATPGETPFLMLQWVDNLKYRLSVIHKVDEITEALAESHIQFERFHPFSDGNGRTGRILNIFLALQVGIAPIVIKVDDRARYIQLLASEDVEGLSELFRESTTFEEERIKMFGNTAIDENIK